MSLELRKKMREISIVIAVIVMISGALGFITQLIQFFIGRWNYTVYEEIGILLLLMGIAVAPYKIIQAFLNKVTNNKSNMSNYDEKEEVVDVEESSVLESGGEGSSKDEKM